MKTVVVNLFGAPCSGKSTAAAYIFSKLKMAGVNAELVTEYCKDMVYDDMSAGWNNQAYIFGNQLHRMERLRGKVNVIVTDSPLLLSAIYANEKTLGAEFNCVVVNKFNSFENYNYLLAAPDGAEYHDEGRVHSQEQSEQIQREIVHTLDKLGFMYETVDRGNTDYYDLIVEQISNLVKSNTNYL